MNAPLHSIVLVRFCQYAHVAIGETTNPNPEITALSAHRRVNNLWVVALGNSVVDTGIAKYTLYLVEQLLLEYCTESENRYPVPLFWGTQIR